MAIFLRFTPFSDYQKNCNLCNVLNISILSGIFFNLKTLFLFRLSIDKG